MNPRALLLVFLVFGSVLVAGCIDSPNMSTLAVSSPMPVKSVDHVSATASQINGNYWRIATVVDGSGEAYILDLPEGILADGDTKAQESLKLKFEPKNPYWGASTYEEYDKLEYKFLNSKWYGMASYIDTAEVPYMRVSGVGQTINTGYKATLMDESGQTIATGEISNFATSETTTGTLQMKAKDNNGVTRTIYVTLDGMMPTGILTPNGDMTVLFDGRDARLDNSYDLVSYSEFNNMLGAWNDGSNEMYIVANTWNSWSDAYDWMANKGLHSQIPTTQVIDHDFEGVGLTDGSSPTGVKIIYGKGTFKPVITVYIPEELADTITEEKAAPEPKIKSIDDITTAEGGSINFKCIVENYGTAGDIQVSASSSGLNNVKTMGDSQQFVGSGKTYTWMFTADVPDEVTDSEKEFKVTVTANGGVGGQFGTTDTETFTLTVKNTDVAPSEMAVLNIKTVFEETGDIYANAPIYVGYGSNARVGSGTATVELIPNIEYAIYSEDTGPYLAQYNESNPYTVTPYSTGEKDITIKFNTERPKDDSDFITFALMVLVVILGLLVLWYTGIIQIFLENPMYILIVLLMLVIIWATITISNAFESAATALEGVKFW